MRGRLGSAAGRGRRAVAVAKEGAVVRGDERGILRGAADEEEEGPGPADQ